MSQTNKRILVVDDEPEIRDIFAMTMSSKGYEVLQAKSGKEALKVIESEKIDLILSDVKMPNGSGIELLEAIHKMAPPKPKIIMISGFSDLTTERSHELGAIALLQKPCSLTDLTLLVKKTVN